MEADKLIPNFASDATKISMEAEDDNSIQDYGVTVRIRITCYNLYFLQLETLRI